MNRNNLLKIAVVSLLSLILTTGVWGQATLSEPNALELEASGTVTLDDNESFLSRLEQYFHRLPELLSHLESAQVDSTMKNLSTQSPEQLLPMLPNHSAEAQVTTTPWFDHITDMLNRIRGQAEMNAS